MKMQRLQARDEAGGRLGLPSPHHSPDQRQCTGSALRTLVGAGPCRQALNEATAFNSGVTALNSRSVPSVASSMRYLWAKAGQTDVNVGSRRSVSSLRDSGLACSLSLWVHTSHTCVQHIARLLRYKNA